jgi:hypothetical protein
MGFFYGRINLGTMPDTMDYPANMNADLLQNLPEKKRFGICCVDDVQMMF